ncbi:hypothetical protein tb265_41480 [Gemmatimonadetes bacterium T265]|nr:hypothetical protein tb265_41480 [Gemmatimonadetes bacterium T265]
MRTIYRNLLVRKTPPGRGLIARAGEAPGPRPPGTGRVPRRPRVARASSTGWSSVALAVALAAFGLGAVAAAVRAHDAHATTGPTLADGVRRLRAAVVGDRPDGVDDASSHNAAATNGLSRAARRALAAVVRHAPRPAPPAGVPRWADTAHWGPDVVFWNDRTTAPLAAEAGDTIALAAPELPGALPAALRARGVHWAVEGAVTLLGDGRAVLDAPGDAVITAVTPAGTTRTPVVVRPVARGRLYAGDDGAPVPARVVVRSGGAAETTWTDAAGRFRLDLPPNADAATPADVRVEPAGAAYAPVSLRGVPPARLHTLGIVLLPARWTMTAGAFAGTTVPVRAAAARGFWQFTAARRRGVGWLRDAPHTVALAPGFDAADSATFWGAAHALAEAWGRPLFVPAAGAPADSDDPEADVVVRPAPGLRADGMTTLGWDESGAIAGVTIEFRVRRPGALEPQVAAHELLHALGFGHARGWGSVLAPAGRPSVAGVTAADVAYGQLHEALLRQARRAEDAYGAAYGWADAVP